MHVSIVIFVLWKVAHKYYFSRPICPKLQNDIIIQNDINIVSTPGFH